VSYRPSGAAYVVPVTFTAPEVVKALGPHIAAHRTSFTATLI
jgi:hypothetical protein